MAGFPDELMAAAADVTLMPSDLRAWMRRAAIHIQEYQIMVDAEQLTFINAVRLKNGEAPIDVNKILHDWAMGYGIDIRDFASGRDDDTEMNGSP
jgi:hypothetical protein